MTKSKSSASSSAVPSIFKIYLINGWQFLNAIEVGSLCVVGTILKCKQRCNHKD